MQATLLTSTDAPLQQVELDEPVAGRTASWD
jgi:hypothetical protein